MSEARECDLRECSSRTDELAIASAALQSGSFGRAGASSCDTHFQKPTLAEVPRCPFRETLVSIEQ